jgi:pimeloyl-ACP methyl ester carboxylesterase
MKRPATDMRPESQFRRREIANNEVRLSYLENHGDGPVVVALHGLAGAGDEFIATAVAVGRSHRFVLPDLRGHGRWERGSPRWHWPRSWIGHLEPHGDGGLVPPFDADVMQAVMEGVSAPRWAEWTSVTAPTTAVFAAKSMFSPAEQAEFIAARPGTRHVILAGGSHDAHLDATAEWVAGLSRALEG